MLNQEQKNSYIELVSFLKPDDIEELAEVLTEYAQTKREKENDIITPVFGDIFFPFLKRDLDALTIR